MLTGLSRLSCLLQGMLSRNIVIHVHECATLSGRELVDSQPAASDARQPARCAHAVPAGAERDHLPISTSTASLRHLQLPGRLLGRLLAVPAGALPSGTRERPLVLRGQGSIFVAGERAAAVEGMP